MTMRLLFGLFLLLGQCVSAQQIQVYVSENGGPAAYHQVKAYQGDVLLGQGQTNGQGQAYFDVPGLRGRAIDLEGFYQSGGKKQEWSIKGKLQLDGNNYVHVDLDEMTREAKEKRAEALDKMEQSKREMEARLEELRKNSPSPDFGKNDFFNDDKLPTPSVDTDNNGGGEEETVGGNKKNGACTAMSVSSFAQAKAQIEKERFSIKKKEKALELLQNNCVNTQQLSDLMDLMMMENERKDLAIAGYKRCSDPGNFDRILGKFTSRIMRSEVERETTKR